MPIKTVRIPTPILRGPFISHPPKFILALVSFSNCLSSSLMGVDNIPAF